MPSCTLCGNYTQLPQGKCYECSANKNEEVDDLLADVLHGDGFASDEWEVRFNMIKDGVAETLIQQLFLHSGYNIFRYGIEQKIPGISELLKGVTNKVDRQIRKMPDFVVQHEKSGNVFFIEVKFRANETFKLAELQKNYPYDNAFIILVSTKHIKCISVMELREGKTITPKCNHHLSNRAEFQLDKDVVDDFCGFAGKIFMEG